MVFICCLHVAIGVSLSTPMSFPGWNYGCFLKLCCSFVQVVGNTERAREIYTAALEFLPTSKVLWEVILLLSWLPLHWSWTFCAFTVSVDWYHSASNWYVLICL
jgi:hypothetical protein